MEKAKRFRIGPRQVELLRELASHPDGLCTADLAMIVYNSYPNASVGYETALAAIRRSLGRLLAKGLTARPTYFRMAGQPARWRINEAGIEYLATQHNRGTTP